MVRVKNNLFTRLQGKVDDVVFFTRWGRLYARKAAVKTARPQTPLQQLQRNRMSDAVTFYGIIRTTFLAAGWREAAREKPYSCMNLFIQRNIGGFDGNGQVTDYSRLHFTAGPLPVCDAPEAVYDAGEGVVWLSWQNRTPLGRARLDDRLVAVVVNGGGEFAVFAPPQLQCLRGEGIAVVPLAAPENPPRWVYVAFVDEAGKTFSDDVACPLN